MAAILWCRPATEKLIPSARYNDKDQTLAIALGWMDVGDLRFAFTDAADKDGYKGRHAHTHDSFTKIIGISYQRNF